MIVIRGGVRTFFIQLRLEGGREGGKEGGRRRVF